MRSVRTVIGLAVLVCAFCAFASAALAKAPKEEKFFGEFVAERVNPPVSEAAPGQIKAKEAEVGELKNIGGYDLKECKMSSKGNVNKERSRTLFETLTLKCLTVSTPQGEGKTEEIKHIHFQLGVEFNANKSAETGEEGEGGFNIVKGSGVIGRISSSKCEVEIPSQFVPVKAGKEPNDEFETVEYETEEEEVAPSMLKKYPSGFKKSLDVFWEMKKVHTILLTSAKCKHPEGGKILENGDVEYGNGFFEGELTELTLKNGNLFFDEEEPAPKV
jgi:hypothetical protein